MLLQHGANVNNVTDTGYNPLHLAASGGHLTSCELLVHAGSPLDEVTEAGLYGAPIHYAAGKVQTATKEAYVCILCLEKNNNAGVFRNCPIVTECWSR